MNKQENLPKQNEQKTENSLPIQLVLLLVVIAACIVGIFLKLTGII